MTFAAFLPVLGNEFLAWDDRFYITDNVKFRGLSLEHLRWMFTTQYGGLYQPLSWVTYALDYELWGLNPRGFHLTNLILHTLNAAAGAVGVIGQYHGGTVDFLGVPRSPMVVLHQVTSGALFYLRATLWPSGLIPIYEIIPRVWAWLPVLGAAVFLVGLTVVFYRLRNSYPAVLACGALYRWKARRWGKASYALSCAVIRRSFFFDLAPDHSVVRYRDPMASCVSIRAGQHRRAEQSRRRA